MFVESFVISTRSKNKRNEFNVDEKINNLIKLLITEDKDIKDVKIIPLRKVSYEAMSNSSETITSDILMLVMYT